MHALRKHVDFQAPDWGELASGPAMYPSYPQVVMADAPVGYWMLAELSGVVGADVTGSHPGVYLNSPILGEPGAIARHDLTSTRFRGFGVGDRLVVPSHSDFDAKPGVMIECWIKPTYGVSEHPRIVCRADNVTGHGMQLAYSRNTPHGHVRARFIGADDLDVTIGAPDLVYDEWHHLVAAVLGDATPAVFHNGEAASGAGGLGLINTINFRLDIGGNNHWVEGCVAHTAIYQKGDTLTAPQVQSLAQKHYHAGLGRLTKP